MNHNTKLFTLFLTVFTITASSLAYILYEQDAEVLSSHTENIQPTSASSTTVFGKVLSDIKQTVLDIRLGKKVRLDEEFATLASEASKAKGEFSIYILDKSTNEEYMQNADHEYYAASLFKLIVAQATYTKIKSGTLSLDTKITLLSQDFEGGTGVLNAAKVGTQFPLDYVLDKLLKDSDNTAQNMLRRYVSDTDLNNELASLPIDKSFVAENEATPKEVAQFYNILYPEVVSKMEQTAFDNRVNAGLASDITFSHKIGSWYDSWHDCGLAKKGEEAVLVCVMSSNTSLDTFQVVSKNAGEFVTELLNQ